MRYTAHVVAPFFDGPLAAEHDGTKLDAIADSAFERCPCHDALPDALVGVLRRLKGMEYEIAEAVEKRCAFIDFDALKHGHAVARHESRPCIDAAVRKRSKPFRNAVPRRVPMMVVHVHHCEIDADSDAFDR